MSLRTPSLLAAISQQSLEEVSNSRCQISFYQASTTWTWRLYISTFQVASLWTETRLTSVLGGLQLYKHSFESQPSLESSWDIIIIISMIDDNLQMRRQPSLYTWDNTTSKILTTTFIPFIINIATPTLIRCDDNPACRWYTWDNRENLCYLKSGRGFLRNRLELKNFSIVPFSR